MTVKVVTQVLELVLKLETSGSVSGSVTIITNWNWNNTNKNLDYAAVKELSMLEVQVTDVFVVLSTEIPKSLFEF